MVVPVRLEEAGRDEHPQLRSKALHRSHRGMLFNRKGTLEMRLVLRAAEIMAFEQLRRQDQLGAFAGRLADQVRHGSDILLYVIAERELQRGHSNLGQDRSS
jgi:hypothetical protein